ncbi:MAG TPA: DUF167 domain-containing protein [Candidatus Nitrosotenuis sp.]|nr:DUF167 domain-containing protein [Candidatus Nitrosotenuis sp.]HIH46080.1 DUF167 domain-containing protein [Candidatus Nitrosotenuis sp.]HIH68295.1 DUF167 domain-containing protein [Candidatus Nitrosotenuis sp.]HII03514.1 DUF167 domain-containing protein [Candidatus Nitrosotenuis sp.]
MLYFVSVIFKQEFVEICGNQITIGIKTKPINGAANKEVIHKLAKYFSISSSNVIVKSGTKSKEKIIEIT